jgi:hypothetical protein
MEAITVLERLSSGTHDPAVLPPNAWSDLLHCVEALCPCGNTTTVRDGVLTTHEPKATWTADGKRRAVISDAYSNGWACRYSGRTVTLDAALARDNILTPAEQRVRDATQSRLEAGITNTAPAGYALPKPVAALFAHAETHGWRTAQAWVPDRDRDTGELYGFVLNLRVSRSVAGGRGWQYDLSYFVAPGVARRTRFGLCKTPDRPGLRDTPSLKRIQAVITAHPAPAEG